MYLQRHWRMEHRPQVFVAMDFAATYTPRFEDVFAPAASRVRINNEPLTAHRVDLSRRGESILTEIIDGIAHAQLVVADVSAIHTDRESSERPRYFRNANVLYEVGLALACRQPEEVIVVRDVDDEGPMIFDVSTIPYLKLPFSDPNRASTILAEEMEQRLLQRSFYADLRVQQAARALSWDELLVIRQTGHYPIGHKWWYTDKGQVIFHVTAAIPRLLDKGMIELGGQTPRGEAAYEWTQLGKAACRLAQQWQFQQPSSDQASAHSEKTDPAGS